MILNDHICTEIGDTIIFNSVIMQNIKELEHYSDNIIGETGTRFFEKIFKFSLDGGVTYSQDWMELNDVNLQSINQFLSNNIHHLCFLFHFKRVGVDNTGQLELISISIDGIHIERQTSFVVSKQTIFKNVIENDINVFNLMVNLASKMFEIGIIPQYLERGGESNDLLNDEDYVDFWETISYFYSILIIDNIKFENIYWKRPVLCEYLKQKTIQLCNCNDIIEMQLIAQNFYAEIKNRGTEEIFKAKGYQYQSGYRYSYKMPNDYEIRPSYPVMIDGVIYKEISELPNGWIMAEDSVVSPDINYHKVLFFNDVTNNYDLLPILKSLIFPTWDSGIFKKYDGEYLRLICYNTCDEFIYNNVPLIYHGWCLGNSSPLYRGLRPQRQRSLIKAYEKTKNVQRLEFYPIINPDNVYIGITTNPEGVQNDTVLYLSSNGEPCFTEVEAEIKNLTNHLNIKILHKAGVNVIGEMIVTNKFTLESFNIPIMIVGDAIDMEIDTGLVPARYFVEFNLQFPNKVVGGTIDDGAARVEDLQGMGILELIKDMDPIGSPIINVKLNFA